MLVRILAHAHGRAAHSCICGCAAVRRNSEIAKREYEVVILKPRETPLHLSISSMRFWGNRRRQKTFRARMRLGLMFRNAYFHC